MICVICLVFLYFHARILIYLPIVSKFGNNHGVGLSEKEKLTTGEGDKSTIVSSMTMIQQSSIEILQILKVFYNETSASCYSLPLPINIAREHSRLAVLVAKGSLDYIKGGSLYLNLKQLLLNTIPLLIRESKYKVPGGLSRNSSKLIEMAILSLLGIPFNKNPLLNKKRQITKPAVNRLPGNNKPAESLTSLINEQSIPELDFIDDDKIDNILQFDPFKVNLSQHQLINEFAADGSLGLVPFLNNRDLDESDLNQFIDSDLN